MPGSSKLKLTIHPYSIMNKKERERGTVFVRVVLPADWDSTVLMGHWGAELWIVPCLLRRREVDLFCSKKANVILGNYIMFISHCPLSTWVIVSIWNKPLSSFLPASVEDIPGHSKRKQPLRDCGQNQCRPSGAVLPSLLLSCPCLLFPPQAVRAGAPT